MTACAVQGHEDGPALERGGCGTDGPDQQDGRGASLQGAECYAPKQEAAERPLPMGGEGDQIRAQLFGMGHHRGGDLGFCGRMHVHVHDAAGELRMVRKARQIGLRPGRIR